MMVNGQKKLVRVDRGVTVVDSGQSCVTIGGIPGVISARTFEEHRR